MATVPGKAPGNSFELQTKIRVIIQQVLAATIRKLSQFNQKIDRFEDYFITFKERFDIVEAGKERTADSLQKVEEEQFKLRTEYNLQSLKHNEEREASKLSENEWKEEMKELEKTIKQIYRQNDNINSELSKTKSKFLEYSAVITGLKEEVAWKITKYLEDTADSHTQIKIYCEQLKNDYFNINLLLDRQKEKYDLIVLNNEQIKNEAGLLDEDIAELKKRDSMRIEDLKAVCQKMDDMQSSLITRIKCSQQRAENKFLELEKGNGKLVSAIKQVDSFSTTLETQRKEIDHDNHNLLKRIEESGRQCLQTLREEILKVNKEALKLQKSMGRRVLDTEEKLARLEDYFYQKLQFVKLQIEEEMSSKTVKILEQKSQSEQALSSSSLEEVNSKINKITLETAKSISRVELLVKESVSEIKKQVASMHQDLQAKMTSTLPTQGNASCGPQTVNLSELQPRFDQIKEDIMSLTEKQQGVQERQRRMQENETEQNTKVQEYFTDLEEKVSSRIQKMMFLVTKIRGDSIIRNEYNDRELKEMRKASLQTKDHLGTIWKIIPALGECANLILSLIYDAEYQHSKLIQDNLPLLTKDIEKFNTCIEGMLYEFKQRKKPGVICYRHQQVKKTDIVRATFTGLIEVWEEIFETDFKSKGTLLPKSFYKRNVERNLKVAGSPVEHSKSAAGNRSGHAIEAVSKQQSHENKEEQAFNQNIRNSMTASNSLNGSFHIRRKKTVSIRQKDDLLMILQEDGNKTIKE